MERQEFNRRGFFGMAFLAFLSPKKHVDKGLGLKQDLPKFREGDTLSAQHMNEIVDRVNER